MGERNGGEIYLREREMGERDGGREGFEVRSGYTLF